MRIWTSIFLLAASLVAAVASSHDGGAIGMLVARMVFAFLVVVALLYGVRVVTLQMAALSDGLGRQPLQRRQPEPRRHPERATWRETSFAPTRASRHSETRKPR